MKQYPIQKQSAAIRFLLPGAAGMLLYLLVSCILYGPAAYAQSGFSPGVYNALGKTQGAAKEKEQRPKGANDPTKHILGSDQGTPGPISGGMPGSESPPGAGTNTTGPLPPPIPGKPGKPPLNICDIIFGLLGQLQQLQEQKEQNQAQQPNGAQPQNNAPPQTNAQPPAPGQQPRPVQPPQYRPGGCPGGRCSVVPRLFRTKLKASGGGENLFARESAARFSRKALSTDQSYQYLGSALIDKQCTERERTKEEVQQLAESLDKVEDDQQRQQNSNSGSGQSGQQGGQIAQQIVQGLLGALGGGGGGRGPFGGGGGGGGPASGGGGEGKNPWQNVGRDTSRPESLSDLQNDPNSMDKLTDKELLELLDKEFDGQPPEDICETLANDPELKKKLEERLEEMKKKEETKPTEESKQVQELKDTDGTPELKQQAEAWNRANETTPNTFTPESQPMVDAINDAVKTNGTAEHFGNEATVAVGNLANDIMKNPTMSAADKATALGSLEHMVYAQQSDALDLISKNPGNAGQYWSNFNHNMGLTAQGLSERLATPQDKWLQSSTTPAGSVNNFLSHAAYPAASNVNQGNYGSCWLCPTTSSNYRVTPGELAMMQNQGLTTGKITSPWTGQTADVSGWLTSSDNALYDPKVQPQNLRSPLVTMDQEAMAQFAGYGRAGGGGDPNLGLNGAYAYTGLTNSVGPDGAAFLNSSAFQQGAYAPGHYWSIDKVNGTTVDASGNYAASQTLIGNNSWASEPFEVAHAATADGLSSITMPGGSGGLGGGGGLGGLGGLFNGFGPLGGNNWGNKPGSNQQPNKPNPADDPAVSACLADICQDIGAQGMDLPESCQGVQTAGSSGQSTTASLTAEERLGTQSTALNPTDGSSNDDRLGQLMTRAREDHERAAPRINGRTPRSFRGRTGSRLKTGEGASFPRLRPLPGGDSATFDKF